MASSNPDDRWPAWAWWVALSVVLAAFGLIRLRLAGTPFERDEGEYAYAAWLLLQGQAPYEHLATMKWPGVFACYAVVLAWAGNSHVAVHTALAVINAATSLTLFGIGRRMLGPAGGLIAASCFAALTLHPDLHGTTANTEHFVLLFAVLGIALLWDRADDSVSTGRLVASGMLFGVAGLMKQHGLAFAAMALSWLIAVEMRRRPRDPRRALRRTAALACGVAAPIVATFAALAATGAFGSFWFWTFTYVSRYAQAVSAELARDNLMQFGGAVLAAAPPIWLLAVVGLSVPLWSRELRSPAMRAGLVLAFGCLAVIPGFYFRPHYFLLLVPGAALAAATGAVALRERLRRRAPAGTLGPVAACAAAVLLVAWPLVAERDLLLRKDPVQVARAIYSANPFPESLEMAERIRMHSEPGDTMAVLGSEPQLYFYARRRAATRYVYMYPLTEEHDLARGMQEEMISEIEAARPKLLVFVNVSTSWLLKDGTDPHLVKWFARYQQRFYRPLVAARIGEDGRPVLFPPDLPPGHNVPHHAITVYERIAP